MKKIDNYNFYSILTFVISVVICLFVIIEALNNAKVSDDRFLLIVNSISSVFSISGLIIAILQIFKVSRNSQVYREAHHLAIAALANNGSISLLSKSLTQLSVIKELFTNRREISSGIYFDNLFLDLTFLKSNAPLDPLDKEKLDVFINYCKEMNTLLYKSGINAIQDYDYSIKYETLNDLQSFLILLLQKLSVPKVN